MKWVSDQVWPRIGFQGRGRRAPRGARVGLASAASAPAGTISTVAQATRRTMARFGPDLRITDAFVQVWLSQRRHPLARVPCSRRASAGLFVCGGRAQTRRRRDRTWRLTPVAAAVYWMRHWLPTCETTVGQRVDLNAHATRPRRDARAPASARRVRRTFAVAGVRGDGAATTSDAVAARSARVENAIGWAVFFRLSEGESARGQELGE